MSVKLCSEDFKQWHRKLSLPGRRWLLEKLGHGFRQDCARSQQSQNQCVWLYREHWDDEQSELVESFRSEKSSWPALHRNKAIVLSRSFWITAGYQPQHRRLNRNGKVGDRSVRAGDGRRYATLSRESLLLLNGLREEQLFD